MDEELKDILRGLKESHEKTHALVRNVSDRLDSFKSEMNEFRRETESQMSEFREEMNEFRRETKAEMNDFREEMNEFREDTNNFREEMNEFRGETNERFDILESRFDWLTKQTIKNTNDIKKLKSSNG